MKTLKLITQSILFLFLLIECSCKGFVTIDPPLDEISTANVYSNDETAVSAIRGIYVNMVTSGAFASGGSNSVTFFAGRSADDFINQSNNENRKQFSDNNLTPENLWLRSGLWQSMYRIIYAANSILENLNQSEKVSAQLKEQLSGEAKFIRAFCYFYLTNLFGEVPLIKTTDYRKNANAFASSKEEVYQQMIGDLKEAKSQLEEDYFSTERIRVNKWAATALLARVYLYHKDWTNAETEASNVIAQTQKYEILTDLNQVFLKNSKEAIFQLSPPANIVNTYEGSFFILNAAPSVNTEVTLSGDLINSFEPGDKRLSMWTGIFTNGVTSWYYPFKYKIKSSTVSSEYSMVLRLAEQYLIRAEARINLNEIQPGITDLNVLRTRAREVPTADVADPLPELSSALSKEAALTAVENERRTELFSEWGHRWLDLKRTGSAGSVLAPLKGANWQSTDLLYPIPASEILNDPNLKQNAGYQ